MRKIFLPVLFLSIFFWGKAVWASGEVTIQWLGHATFLIESSQGSKLLTDPLGEETGYPIPQVMPDVITISHEHFDHNYVRPYKDVPRVIRGLTPDGRDWQKVDEKVKDVRIYNVFTYHDKLEGRERGKNAVFVFELDGLRIAQLGDLGHLLTREQLEAIGSLDVLLIPTGGVYTIDPREATAVMEQLKPRLTIPMHYHTPVCQFNIYKVTSFLKGKDNVRKVDGDTLRLSKETLPQKPEIVVLNYK